ncbi:MAG: hypothetical protein SGBAC_011312 [Bacillariaceae sp.]
MQALWFRALFSCFSVSLVSGLLADQHLLYRKSTSALCSRGPADYKNADGATTTSIEDDFATFMNQCSIQSFLFLMVSLRDVDTAIWLEQHFTKPVLGESSKDTVHESMKASFDRVTQDGSKDEEIKLLSYHGLSAINRTLFPYWNSYFDALLEEQDVTMVFSANFGVEYEVNITPSSLCSRLISVREQIAREFARDLDRIIDISSSFIDDYDEFKTNGQGNDHYRTNLLFLYLPMEEEAEPSPLRKGNFDLLMLFILQESILRVLNSAEDDVDLMLLRNVYDEKRHSHFVGSVNYGRSDDFLVGLLESSCSIQLQDEEVGFVDPLRVVKLVLQSQATVALELIEVALETPNDHLELKRRQLQRLSQIDK